MAIREPFRWFMECVCAWEKSAVIRRRRRVAKRPAERELWKGRWQGNDIVVKVLKVRDWTTRKSRDFNEEYPKLRIFSHPNVLPMLGACQSPPAPHPIIITHWMPYGSLYNVLHEGTTINAVVLYKECTGNTITRRDFILQLALELRQKHFDKRHESRLANAPQPSSSAAPTGTQLKTLHLYS
ncbi:UNVERIFIED_CONTAM: hypothetical protein FKN15_005883 [Acipenser sinensis]